MPPLWNTNEGLRHRYTHCGIPLVVFHNRPPMVESLGEIPTWLWFVVTSAVVATSVFLWSSELKLTKKLTRLVSTSNKRSSSGEIISPDEDLLFEVETSRVNFLVSFNSDDQRNTDVATTADVTTYKSKSSRWTFSINDCDCILYECYNDSTK